MCSVIRDKDGDTRVPGLTFSSLTRAPLALQIFHHLLGGGGECSNTPRLSRLLLVVEKNGKNRSKSLQKLLRNYFSQFLAKVKILDPRAKKWSNFRVSRDCQTSFRKTSIISGTVIARANPKSAFERELNFPSLRFRQS